MARVAHRPRVPPSLRRGRGAGGEGDSIPRGDRNSLATDAAVARDSIPPQPDPLPPKYRGERESKPATRFGAAPHASGFHCGIEHSHLAYPIDLLARPLAVHVETGPPDRRPRQFTWRQRSYDVVRAWGPQRIETGWWRGRDIRRDYFRVEAAGGERFWLFRDRTREAWFLHGVFA